MLRDRRGENPIGADIRRVFWIRWLAKLLFVVATRIHTPLSLSRAPLSRRYRPGWGEGGLFSRVGETDRRLMKTL